MRSSTTSTILLALSGCLPALAAPLKQRAASANTILVLSFANALEQLETEFYKQALAKFSDADFTSAGFTNVNVPKEQFIVIQGDEATHRDVLASTLTTFGATAPVCSFDFSSVLGDVKTMAATARVVENLGVSAYLGAAALIDDPQILNAAASILTVEARHQTILNLLLGGSTISSAFDMVLSPPQVLATAAAFITSGCDLGVTPNPALAITNTGSVGVGTQLSLSSKAITGSTANLTCQMMVGGAPFAIVLPFDNCVVPAGINGLVYIYAVNTTQPLLSNIQNQFANSIVAGPTAAFIDTQPEAISQAILGGAAVASSPSSSSGSSGSSSSASSNSAGAGVSSTISTTTISPAAASSIAASATASAASTAATNAGTAAIAALGGKPNEKTGPNGPVDVLGWGEIPR